jgi:hypothetical protein
MENLNELSFPWNLSHISDEMIALLPRLLLQLTLNAQSHILTGACFQFLPRFLQVFSTHLRVDFQEEDLLNLPRTLRQFTSSDELWRG